MPKTAPCYSKIDYYDFFNFDISNKKILDIGSSVGSFKKSKRFLGSSLGLKSSEKYITIDIDPGSGADIIGDAHKLPFKKDEFDVIIANNVIEHFYDPNTAVAEMLRVLKKGGEIYFTVPFLYPIHEAPHDYSRLTRYGLEKLFEHFNNIEIHERGGFFSTTADFCFKVTNAFNLLKIGNIARFLMYPPLWLWVQLDRFDTSGAFTRVYFGRVQK